MTRLTTPYHWAFCDEEHPASHSHRFCLLCSKGGVERRIATSVPTLLPVLQTGWPGLAPPEPKRDRKAAAPESVSYDKLN